MTPDLQTFALRLLDYLKRERTVGRITPERCKTSTEILKAAKVQGFDFDDADFRKAIHWLRTEKGELIGTSNTTGNIGCCLCLNIEEFKKINEHLKSRAVEIFQAYYAPLKKHEHDKELLLEFKDEPIVQDLIREFEAVQV